MYSKCFQLSSKGRDLIDSFLFSSVSLCHPPLKQKKNKATSHFLQKEDLEREERTLFFTIVDGEESFISHFLAYVAERMKERKVDEN